MNQIFLELLITNRKTRKNILINNNSHFILLINLWE